MVSINAHLLYIMVIFNWWNLNYKQQYCMHNLQLLVYSVADPLCDDPENKGVL